MATIAIVTKNRDKLAGSILKQVFDVYKSGGEFGTISFPVEQDRRRYEAHVYYKYNAAGERRCIVCIGVSAVQVEVAYHPYDAA